jgi:hypothetical protein
MEMTSAADIFPDVYHFSPASDARIIIEAGENTHCRSKIRPSSAGQIIQYSSEITIVDG